MSDGPIAIPPYIADTLSQAPIPMSIYDRTGTCIAFNDAHGALWGIRREGWIGHFNMVTDPQLAASGSPALFQKVMGGETIVIPPAPYDTAKSEIQAGERIKRWVEAIYFPVRDSHGGVTHLGAILRDVTLEMEQNESIEAARMEIAAQRLMIETLASPVVQIWQGILMMPLIGAIDSHRATTITESLLLAIASHQADSVILDITGVPMVDTQVAQHLIQTAQACALLGSDVALVGISVGLAQTLVHLGVDLGKLITLADLQAGIAWAFARQRLGVVPIDEPRTARNVEVAV